jgi:hypothetical protein
MEYLQTVFWLAFGVTVAFIAWQFLRMLVGIGRDPWKEHRTNEPHRADTGGITGDTADVNSPSAESGAAEGGSDSGSGESSGGGDSSGDSSGGGRGEGGTRKDEG